MVIEGVRGFGGRSADCDGDTVVLEAGAPKPNNEGGRRFRVEVGKLEVLSLSVVVGLSKNCTGRLGRRESCAGTRRVLLSG